MIMFSPGESHEGEGERTMLSPFSPQLQFPLSLLPDEDNLVTKVVKAEMSTGLRLIHSFIRSLPRATFFLSSAVFGK